MRNSADHVLNAFLSGRSLTLQALIKHFITVAPSLAGELNSLLSEAPGAFHQSPLSEQENILEDCVVGLFRKLCNNGKQTVLIHNFSYMFHDSRILHFCGPNFLERLRQAGYNSWIIDRHAISDTCLPLDNPLLERMDFISLILVGPWGFSFDHNQRTKTFKLPFSASLAPEWEDCILVHPVFAYF